jgi:putative multiple sugar transport system substrate-binding protein
MRQLLFAGLVAGGLLVSACGGDNASIAPSASPAESAAATASSNESAAPAAAPSAADLVGVLLPTGSSALWVAHGERLAASLAQAGYASDVQFAQDDVPTQVAQVEDMIEKGAKALAIAAVDGAALTEVLQKAGDAGIKVLAYDRLISDTPNVDYYLTFDPFEIGVLQAESIVTALDLREAAGPFNIELFAGSPDDRDAGPMLEGAMSILGPFIDQGRLIVQSGETWFPEQIGTLHWSSGTAQARMDNLLNPYYVADRVDAVLSPRDAMSRGIIASLKQAGYYTAAKPGPAVTGQDAELQAVTSILAGEQTSTVFRDIGAQAAQAATMIDQMLRGRTVDVNDTKTYDNGAGVVPTYLLNGVSVSADNVRELLVEGGYYTAEEVEPEG